MDPPLITVSYQKVATRIKHVQWQAYNM